jgi:hypothetical protein
MIGFETSLEITRAQADVFDYVATRGRRDFRLPAFGAIALLGSCWSLAGMLRPGQRS